METLFADVRYGARLLLQRPGVTAIALLTLAIGIGANSAIFSVVNGVLLRPLPYPAPEQLLMLWQDQTRLDGPATEWVSPDNFFDWRDQSDVFSGMFALSGWTPTLTGMDEPELLNGIQASYEVFSVLGTAPWLGRGFGPEDDRPSSPLVLVLSHSLWQRRFGGDPSVVGRKVALDDEPATVIGVLAPETPFPAAGNPDFWAPLRTDASNSCGRGCVTLQIVARLSNGVSLTRARTEMETLAARLEREHPEDNRGVGITLQPLHEQLVGSIRPALLVLLGAVALVLLIACANVANLMLARAVDREREVAMRIAMGASRIRLLRQLLTESLLLSILGSALGVFLALWGVDLLVSLVPSGVPRLSEVRVDGRVLGFTLLLALATGLLFGLVPALRGSTPDVHRSLKEGSRGSTTGGARRFRGWLVVSEVALALALLVGASLLIESFRSLTRVDPGFDAKNVLTAGLNLPTSRYQERERRIDFVGRLLARVSSLPSVTSAGVVNALPMGGADADASFLIEGREPPQPNQSPVAWYRSVSPEYFATLKVALLRGRLFVASDDGTAPPVVLINETASRRYWPGEEPLLARVRVGGEWRRVVGVVADTKHFGLDAADRPALYFPYDQIPLTTVNLVVRTEGDPESVTSALHAAVAELDPELAVAGAGPLAEVVSRSVSTSRATTFLFTVFAALALVLAAIGLYGIMSYSVGQQFHEIGIRMALGARGGDVIRSTVAQGAFLLGAGIALGLVLAFLSSRWLASLLHGVSATDPVAFVTASAVLLLTAFVACFLPARRAARIDPIVALRHE